MIDLIIGLWRRRYPILGVMFGLCALIGSCYVVFKNWSIFREFPREPWHLPLEQAAALSYIDDGVWVDIEEATWDCQNIINKAYSGYRPSRLTLVIFTDEKRSTLGVVEFTGTLTCSDFEGKHIKGVLFPMSDEYYANLTGEGFNITPYKNARWRVTLCSYAGRRNSVLGLLLGVGGIVGGLYIFGGYLKKFKSPITI